MECIVSAGVLRRAGQERAGQGLDLAKRAGQALKGRDKGSKNLSERAGQGLDLAKRAGHPACPALKGRDKETMHGRNSEIKKAPRGRG